MLDPEPETLAFRRRHMRDIAERHRLGVDRLRADVLGAGLDLLGRVEGNPERRCGEALVGRALRVAGRAARRDDLLDLGERDGGRTGPR